jgi:hypothetical protein
VRSFTNCCGGGIAHKEKTVYKTAVSPRNKQKYSRTSFVFAKNWQDLIQGQQKLAQNTGAHCAGTGHGTAPCHLGNAKKTSAHG